MVCCSEGWVQTSAAVLGREAVVMWVIVMAQSGAGSWLGSALWLFQQPFGPALLSINAIGTVLACEKAEPLCCEMQACLLPRRPNSSLCACIIFWVMPAHWQGPAALQLQVYNIYGSACVLGI